jgi:hypothetical protein
MRAEDYTKGLPIGPGRLLLESAGNCGRKQPAAGLVDIDAATRRLDDRRPVYPLPAFRVPLPLSSFIRPA